MEVWKTFVPKVEDMENNFIKSGYGALISL